MDSYWNYSPLSKPRVILNLDVQPPEEQLDDMLVLAWIKLGHSFSIRICLNQAVLPYAVVVSFLSLRRRSGYRCCHRRGGHAVRMPSLRDLPVGDWTIVRLSSVEPPSLTLPPAKACAAGGAAPSTPNDTSPATSFPSCFTPLAAISTKRSPALLTVPVRAGEFSVDSGFDRT
ncbi:hypothetical protein GALMADRAFT_1140320 [Galerina marginata CBS 339.88]|uniref:Uncharacterized protein n=1 Tax=Galerina marginata (strain CBS 339.88) TaxID=685588 RepID=A0A067SG83_GALM3|nr:hypothetical protein GALMADRAFT_1140320 [Galerina marginata CBS 339.88]